MRQRGLGRPGRIGLLAAAVVVLAGVGAAWFAWAQEDQRVEARRTEVTNAAARDVAEATNQSLTAIAIVDGIAADGSVTPAEFAAYAGDVVQATSYKMLAREVQVDAAGRDAFERSSGVRILDLAPGGFAPAAPRSQYLPVIDVSPVDPSTPSVLGFDILGEPVRAEAARQATTTLGPVLSAPVTLAGSDRVGSFVVMPLVSGDRDGAHQIIGFVSSGIATEDLAGPARERLPDGASLSVTDGDVLLTGPEPGPDAATSEVAVGERTWMVSVAGAASASRAWPIAILAGSVLVASLLVVLTRRDSRDQRRRDVESERNAKLATIARRLSFALRTDDAITIVEQEMAATIGADRARVLWVIDPAHLAAARTSTPASGGSEVSADLDIVRRDSAHHAARALRERRTVIDDGPPAVAACPLYGADGAPLGVLLFEWSAPLRVDDSLGTTLETLARLVGQTVRRTRITGDANDVAELAGELASAATETELAERIQAHAAAMLGASRVAIRTVDPTGRRLVPIGSATLSPALEERWGDLEAGPTTPSATTFRDGSETWIETRHELVDRFPELAGVEEVADFAAVAALPVLTSSGEVIGAIAIWWEHDHYLDAQTRTVVHTLRDLTAQTLERVRLGELAAEHARQSQAIAELGEALALADTLELAVAELARTASRAVGASSSLVALKIGDRLHFTDGGPGGDWSRAISDDAPAGAALLSGDLVLVEDGDEFERRFSIGEPGEGAVQPGALAAVPMRDDEGTAFGAIVLSWDRPQRFVADDAARFRTLGAVAERTLERTRLRQALADAQQQVVVDLQRQLLAPVDTVAGVEVAAIYEPASLEIGMGGDWYDAVSLPDGSLAIVVGDVVGHGVAAVASMAQLQNLVSGLIRSGTPLQEVLDQVSAMASPGTLATAQLLHLDPGADRLAYLNAGHPWALLRTPAGDVTMLDAAGRTLLGIGASSPPMAQVAIPPGSLVLAYTDGLVERRGELIDDSIRRLADVLAATDPGGPIDDVLQDLLTAFRTAPGHDGSVDDDVAVVLARVHRRPQRQGVGSTS